MYSVYKNIQSLELGTVNQVAKLLDRNLQQHKIADIIF